MDYLKDFKKEIKENEDYEKRQSEFFETLEKKHSIEELGSTPTIEYYITLVNSTNGAIGNTTVGAGVNYFSKAPDDKIYATAGKFTPVGFGQ